jgi:endoglucanase
MKLQDGATGAVYAGVTLMPAGDDTDATFAFVEPPSVAATKMFCAAMAKVAYLYQGISNSYATECLRAADRAWRYLERNHTDLLDEMYFLAAAEMYRASGYQVYNRTVISYLNSEDFQDLFVTNHDGTQLDTRRETILMGAITYLLTKRRVDRELANELTRIILQKGEDIAARSRLSWYLAVGNERQDNNAELLADMFVMSVVNFIITNYEYGVIIENHIHYLSGRNSAAISYIDDIGDLNYKDIDGRLGIMNHIETNAKLFFILNGLRSTAHLR